MIEFLEKGEGKAKGIDSEIDDAEEEKRKTKHCRAEGKHFCVSRHVARTLQGRKSLKNKKAPLDIKKTFQKSMLYEMTQIVLN